MLDLFTDKWICSFVTVNLYNLLSLFMYIYPSFLFFESFEMDKINVYLIVHAYA